MLFQLGLFCPCGASPAVSGFCRRCYRARWRSRSRFGGNRDRVLARDRSCCRVCGTAGAVIVHHRAPGKNAPALLATLCRPCHAALHHRHQPSGWWPDLLVALWEEQHDRLPRQLAFEFTPAAPAAKAA